MIPVFVEFDEFGTTDISLNYYFIIMIMVKLRLDLMEQRTS